MAFVNYIVVNYILQQRNFLSRLPPEELAQQLTRKPLGVRLHTWAEKTDTIVFIIQGTQVCYVNPATEVITGYTKEELLLHTHLHQLLELQKHTQLCQWGGSAFPQYQEIKILTKSGEECWLDCSVTMLEVEGEQALLVTAIDITKRKQAEAEVRATLKQEKELGERRARFVSMFAHEFRCPLNIISFSTSLLSRHSHQWTEEKKQSYLVRIQAAVEQLSQLMDEVLLIGRAEAGKLVFEPKVFGLEQFCRNLVEELQLSDSNQHTVAFISRGDCKAACLDQKLLLSILTNVLDNAIKYSPIGSTIHLELCRRHGEVIFQIKDVGIGIPAVDRQLMFEPFHRGSNVGDVPGTGLGLAIVKKLVAIHNGQISVMSEVGVGTTFTFVLPTNN